MIEFNVKRQDGADAEYKRANSIKELAVGMRVRRNHSGHVGPQEGQLGTVERIEGKAAVVRFDEYIGDVREGPSRLNGYGWMCDAIRLDICMVSMEVVK